MVFFLTKQSVIVALIFAQKLEILEDLVCFDAQKSFFSAQQAQTSVKFGFMIRNFS